MTNNERGEISIRGPSDAAQEPSDAELWPRVRVLIALEECRPGTVWGTMPPSDGAGDRGRASRTKLLCYMENEAGGDRGRGDGMSRPFSGEKYFPEKPSSPPRPRRPRRPPPRPTGFFSGTHHAEGVPARPCLPLSTLTAQLVKGSNHDN